MSKVRSNGVMLVMLYIQNIAFYLFPAFCLRWWFCVVCNVFQSLEKYFRKWVCVLHSYASAIFIMKYRTSKCHQQQSNIDWVHCVFCHMRRCLTWAATKLPAIGQDVPIILELVCFTPLHFKIEKKIIQDKRKKKLCQLIECLF